MNPEDGKKLKIGKAYFRPIGADPETTEWQELGTVKSFTVVDPYIKDLMDLKMIKTWSITQTFKLPTLKYRAFRTTLGMPNSSLIYNGKKRRK